MKSSSPRYQSQEDESPELIEDLSICPSIFQDKELVKIPNGNPALTTGRSLNSKWSQDRERNVYYQNIWKDNDSEPVIIKVFLTEGETQAEILKGSSAFARLESRHPELSKLFWLILACFEHSESWNSQLCFSAKQSNRSRYIKYQNGTNLISLMGWENRNDIKLTEKINKLESYCHQLRSLWVEINYPHKQVNDHFFHIATEKYGQYNLFDREIEPIDLVVTVQLGLWAKDFYNRASKFHYGFIHKSTLELNPYRSRLAFLIAIAIVPENNINPTGEYQVETVLDRISYWIDKRKAKTDKNAAKNLINQFNHALLELIAIGWNISFDPSYPVWLRPNITERKPSNIKDKVINIFLKSKLFLLPPNTLESEINIPTVEAIEIPIEDDFIPHPLVESIDWDTIWKACIDKGWCTQTVVGEKLGIGQRLVSKLVNQQTVSPQTWKKIYKALPLVLPELLP